MPLHVGHSFVVGALVLELVSILVMVVILCADLLADGAALGQITGVVVLDAERSSVPWRTWSSLAAGSVDLGKEGDLVRETEG